MPDKTSPIATAYHEAGHVVVAHHFNIAILRGGVSIESDESSDGHACISTALGGNPEYSSGKVRLRAEKRVLALLAGMEAQEKYNPRSLRSHHAHDDYRKAITLMREFVGSDEELEAYLKWLVIRARQIVSNPLLWLRIQAVAKALVERGKLTRTEVIRIIRSATSSLTRTSDLP